MPNISKINALAIGSVGKVDGLAKASILNIDGVAVPSAVLAPEAAYSVRLLGSAVGISSYTGPAMRVRRETAGGAGDDDEADVAFDTSLTDPAVSLDSAISNASAGVTATTLGQFLNVGTVGGTTYTNPDSLTVTASCFVDEWKDQSGNANHATQGTFGIQPQIHSGTVNTDLILENGKPCLKIVNDYFVLSPTLSLGSSMLTVVSCHKGASFQETLTWDQRLYYRGSGSITMFANTAIFGTVSGISTQNLITAQFDSVTSVGRFNGTQFASGSTGTTGTIQGVMSRGIGLQTTPNATVQEMIKWSTWNSGNISNVESDVMTYFGIS